MWQRDRLDIDRRTYEPEVLLGSPRPAMNWTFTRRHLIPLAAAAIIAAGQLLSFLVKGVTMQFGGRSLDCIVVYTYRVGRKFSRHPIYRCHPSSVWRARGPVGHGERVADARGSLT